MNKIIEILDKKEKETNRTGSMFDWVEGYPESQWKILCQLENGDFFEDENEITFITTENERISLPKEGFLTEKTSEKAIYNAPMQLKIEKSLVDQGVFEITDRVGHYIKVKVEPMFDEMAPSKKDYKSVNLNGQQLALLYMALSKGLFNRPNKGQMYYESRNDGSCTLFFRRDYYASLTDSIFTAYYQRKFAQSNAESDWNNLKDTIDRAEISTRDNVEELNLYSLYDE